MNGVFIKNNNVSYNLRNPNPLKGRNVNAVRYGKETISYLAPKIWEIIPKHIKESKSLDIFKQRIRNWSPENCPCRLCKKYVKHVGFIN